MRRNSTRLWKIGFLLAVLVGGPRAVIADQRDELRKEYAGLQQRFASQMQSLAEQCEARGQTDAVDRIRSLAVPFDQQTVDVDELPVEVRPAISLAEVRDERDWQAALRKLQSDYAVQLYQLSRKALRYGSLTMAFHLVREVAFHDPDHVNARRLLGYVRYQNRWATPYEAQMLRLNFVWHDTFGWLPKSHVDRYERGERNFNGRWLSADKEAASRTDFKNAWVIESDHFRIRTNHSLERGVELSVALEEFHRFFLREYAVLFNTPQQMQMLFDNTRAGGPAPAGKHEIWYLRTRDEFVQVVNRKQPGAEIYHGVYLPGERVAYFFDNPANPEGNLQTMFHEVTHQLLSESARSTFDIATDADFWVVEGIACYIESYRREQDGRLSVGNPRHIRIQGAKERIALDNWFIPIEKFSAMGMREFQNGADYPTLQKYYTQATGLTHFFLHYNDGQYRDRFLDYLASIYSPDKRIRLNRRPLDQLLGTSFEILNEQYRTYIVEQ